jgi:hypothetical protein
MTSDFKKQVYRSLENKETEELLDIWKKNNRSEWSDIAFDVIQEILINRGINIPEQVEPTYQNNKNAQKVDEDGFTKLENKILDDENPPEFYEPFDVLKIQRQLEFVAKAVVILTIVYNLINFSNPLRLAQSWLYQIPNTIPVYILAFLIMGVNTIVGIALAYFPLIALSRILRILMQMEYNSRTQI